MTNLKKEGVTLVLIGKALDGIESARASGRRFQHHPLKSIIVELMVLDGSVEVLHQAWVKRSTQKFVLLIIVIIVGEMLTFKLGTAGITCFTIYKTPDAMQVIVLNNQFSTLSKILKKITSNFLFSKNSVLYHACIIFGQIKVILFPASKWFVCLISHIIQSFRGLCLKFKT